MLNCLETAAPKKVTILQKFKMNDNVVDAVVVFVVVVVIVFVVIVVVVGDKTTYMMMTTMMMRIMTIKTSFVWMLCFSDESWSSHVVRSPTQQQHTMKVGDYTRPVRGYTCLFKD